MTTSTWLLAGLFLPLFPLSMGFNLLFARVPTGWPRALLLLAWPQLGLGVLTFADARTPPWLVAWALLTAGLYGFRALALREVGAWTGFLATSAWAMLWVAAGSGVGAAALHVHALGLSAPLVLLVFLGAGLERRFGAAYTGLYGGLAQALPRFATVLVLVVLAVTATPVFPAFTTMLDTVVAAVPAAPAVAVGSIAVWILWSWAGARLLQGLVTGRADIVGVPDLDRRSTTAYALMLLALAGTGLLQMGVLS